MLVTLSIVLAYVYEMVLIFQYAAITKREDTIRGTVGIRV